MSQLATVLIVDDDNIHLNVVESMVKTMGFSVLTATDGIRAISTFEKHADTIGCILLDIQMPQMNGIEVLQRLRKMGEDVEVIIVSGQLDSAKREQLDLLSAREYLEKPVGFQTLSEAITRCI